MTITTASLVPAGTVQSIALRSSVRYVSVAAAGHIAIKQVGDIVSSFTYEGDINLSYAGNYDNLQSVEDRLGSDIVAAIVSHLARRQHPAFRGA
jgi:hypothetical protein